ncbi:lipopolysaccharide-induced tumor necrosis factor-alpha factor homolog [Maniola hyperantus]|uniref:lipopolysaccharide-induced tumor necrosis factor-alpha factor homolog n=1 Tax=Aphantopus hyperantus TaxID=2795564 RepID=UPI00156840B1|nr:lipopolysaccharide-induced tumor necrosis factor-alpha factor homolog [Maniola hyperantus]
METKNRDNMESYATAQAHSYPGPDPPPYPGFSPGPAQPVYPPVMNQPQVTVIHPNTRVMGATVIVTNSMAPAPTSYVCRSCNHQIVTRVERVPSMRTHLFAALLCLIGCWPCVCVPYCVDSCNNAEHYCPNCNAYIGSYTG